VFADTRVLIGKIFTDLRHLCILLSKGRRMITLGMDPHPGSHTVAALDSNGSLLGSVKVLNTSAGLEQLHQFASQFASRRWAIEGAGNRFVAQFVNELLAKGETILCHRAESDQSVSMPARNKENDQVDAAKCRMARKRNCASWVLP
jgi:hypothetical protein